MSGFDQSNYVDVKERIQRFYADFPHGSLQCKAWDVIEVGDATFIYYEAVAYREPYDPRPAHGTAWEPVPGPTNFTKDSELMNAETAAWGRAIASLGIATDKAIASRQEAIRMEARGEEPIPKDRAVVIYRAWQGSGLNFTALSLHMGAVGAIAPKTEDDVELSNSFQALTPAQADALERIFKAEGQTKQQAAA